MTTAIGRFILAACLAATVACAGQGAAVRPSRSDDVRIAERPLLDDRLAVDVFGAPVFAARGAPTRPEQPLARVEPGPQEPQATP